MPQTIWSYRSSKKGPDFHAILILGLGGNIIVPFYIWKKSKNSPKQQIQRVGFNASVYFLKSLGHRFLNYTPGFIRQGRYSYTCWKKCARHSVSQPVRSLLFCSGDHPCSLCGHVGNPVLCVPGSLSPRHPFRGCRFQEEKEHREGWTLSPASPWLELDWPPSPTSTGDLSPVATWQMGSWGRVSGAPTVILSPGFAWTAGDPQHRGLTEPGYSL